jgi:hypothetical protein
MLRLRQIALVAHNLDPIEADLQAVFGLGTAFNDPHIDIFGLRNAVIPAGRQFIEIVSPVQENTAGGRYLERRNGDGGYMTIFQCDDHPAVKGRADELGIRRVVDQQGKEYWILQLHPADTGGTFLEIDVQHGGESLDGLWEPAGKQWRDNITDTLVAITAAEVQSPNPAPLAERWSRILAVPATVSDGGTVHTLTVDNATVRFVVATDGRPEGLGGIDVTVRWDQLDAVLARAADRGLSSPGDPSLLHLGGMRIRVLPA